MAYGEAIYYWLICDTCGARSTEGSDYAAWAEKSGAEADAHDNAWVTSEVGHFCSGCVKWCPDCESEEIPKFLDFCGECEAKDDHGSEFLAAGFGVA